MTQLHDQTLALASMFQSATLINQLAHGKPINQAAFDCSMDSLFTLEANSTEDIFGYGDGLIQGLKTLIDYLDGQHKSPERVIAYYVLSMIKLESRLLKNKTQVQQVHSGLESIQKQAVDFEMSQSAKAHKVDGLYQKTVSTLKPRIIVQGEQVHLNNSDNTSKVRTLLFAGIRAAVLWRQKGGSRLRLLFSRKKYVQQAQKILQQF
ncbi:MAG: high frequency lysogenization protein HflD [Gammaproteobacteria bacterium]|nr:high frequency lysogenization protein HflD [Gammaproteobacteria bacterium]MBL7000011.1 high frequency lysogenization protein HflD [Gammaproteobacteria bacterium]